MRLNRKIRIGAAIVAVALLLLGLVNIVNSLRGRNAAAPSLADNSLSDPGAGDNAATPALVSSSTVAVARRDIAERAIITSDMLEVRPAREGEETEIYVNDPATDAVGFITSRTIKGGSSLRRRDLVGHISDVGIAGVLLPGRRAMVIPIPNKSTLHDLVRIGDRVDVLASFEQQEARVVAEDVRVLAVDVFGRDYPQVKIAMRGDYKAPARSVGAAVPSSPQNAGGAGVSGTGAGGAGRATTSPDAPPGQTGAGQAGQGGAPAVPPAAGGAPEPTPTEGPPPARPDPALTIEVTPQQATDIALTQALGQNLDFVLIPRSEPRPVVPGATGTDALGGVTLAGGTGTVRSGASTTRDRLAPFATRAKRASPPAAGAAARAAGGGTGAPRSSDRTVRDTVRDSGRPARGNFGSFDGPTIPPPREVNVPPAPLGDTVRVAPEPPATYDIPIYGDGKLIRTDTVKRPRE
jgi:Flp pilus assembly protein CpaB